MQEIAQFISQVGFPIVAFCLMFKLVSNQMKENTEAINNNSKVLTKLTTLFDSKAGDENGE